MTRRLRTILNGGTSLDLTAPGGDITVDQNGDGYGDGVLQQTFQGRTWGYYFFQGTSMAAPHVAGVAALVISQNVNLTPAEVREALESTAKDKGAAGWDPEYGWGIVDAYAALQWSSGPVDSPPTVKITSPENDATVSGIINVTADAADDNGVTQVEFFVDDVSIGVDDTYPYGVSWNSASVGDGSHIVSATSTDTAGKTGNDAINVTVDNIDSPPIVAIVYPASGSNVSGVIDVIASATDDKDVTQVEFFVDGGSIGVDTNRFDGWSASWDTTTGLDGSHTVSATATDTASHKDTDSITVTVNNSTPSVTMYVKFIDIGLIVTKVAGKNTFMRAEATVTIWDAEGKVVEGATVYGFWSGATSDTDVGVTNSLGKVTLSSDAVRVSSGTTFVLTVDDVVKSGFIYDNADPIASITVP